MKFGLFYEHQLPRPWIEGDELKLFQDALAQVQLADELGIDHVWEVEHHFSEEYSHSSAPEVFLAACSQRTKSIRLGHGIVLMPPHYNHPARVAERIATLDLVSSGRVEWGTGESTSILELSGFGISVEHKRAYWREAVEQCANMMVMDPYPGFEGVGFTMPCRTVVPKPVQKPHPPLWMACSNIEAVKTAARCGMGALTFAFVDASQARMFVEAYYETLKTECVPIGHAINPNIAMVSAFGLHADREEARRRFLEGFQFFGFSLGYYLSTPHQPGRRNLWELFQARRAAGSLGDDASGIGTPEEMRAHLRDMEAAGVDQVAFIQQGGRNRHEHICEALSLFASEVMPEFSARAASREARKLQDLAPYLDAAMGRKPRMPALRDEDIPVVEPRQYAADSRSSGR